jgi:uncharacterized protein YggE
MRVHRLIVAVAAAALLAPAAAQAQQPQPLQGISVVGEAQSFADNDIGTFRFGVTVRRKTAAAALRSAGAAVQRIVGSSRATGVKREDVQTDVVNVRRERTRKRGTTWIARNAVSVTVRNLDDAGTVVDRAVGAGATSVEGPQLGVADLAEVYRRTLGSAFAEAKAKAERLAAEAGVKLGAPVRIRESGADDFVEDTSGGGSTSREVSAAPQAESAPVERGRTSVTATVAVTFAVVSP